MQAGIRGTVSQAGASGGMAQAGAGGNVTQAGGGTNAGTSGVLNPSDTAPGIGRERMVRPSTALPASPRTRQSDTGIGTRRPSGVSGAINRNRGGVR